MLSLFFVVFKIVAPVFIIVLLGYGYGKFRHTCMQSTNRLIMDVFVPALIFAKLTQQDFPLSDYTHLALAASLVILGSGLVLWPWVIRSRIQARTLIPPIMFPNAANMGLPLQVFAFGEAALPAAVVLLIVFNVLQFSVGIYLLERRWNVFNMLRQPVIIAAILAVLFRSYEVTLPDVILKPVVMLGDVCIPLMLFALGVRFTTVKVNDIKLGLIAAVITPCLGVAIAHLVNVVIPLDGQQYQYLILFAALPPALMSFLLAERYQQEPEKVASIVFIGNASAMISLPIVLMLLLHGGNAG